MLSSSDEDAATTEESNEMRSWPPCGSVSVKGGGVVEEFASGTSDSRSGDIGLMRYSPRLSLASSSSFDPIDENSSSLPNLED